MTSFGSGIAGGDVEQFDIEALLRRAVQTVNTAKSMPLSASVIVPRDEMIALLAACLDNLPAEIRQANWLLKERAEFLAKMEREGDEIIRAARERAERMVSRSELVREAERTAQRRIDDASAEARRLEHEAEDYCDQRLAAFEVVLERTWRSVQAGREKLRGGPVITIDQTRAPEDNDKVFDQEHFEHGSARREKR